MTTKKGTNVHNGITYRVIKINKDDFDNAVQISAMRQEFANQDHLVIFTERTLQVYDYFFVTKANNCDLPPDFFAGIKWTEEK